MNPRLRSLLTLLVAALTAAAGFFFTPPPDEILTSSTTLDLPEARVAQGMRAHGWIPMVGPRGEPLVEPPLYPFALTAIARVAPPNIGWIMTPKEARPPLEPEDEATTQRARAVVQRAPRVLGALAAFFAALTGAAAVLAFASPGGARDGAVLGGALAGGLACAVASPAIAEAASAWFVSGPVVFAAALFALALWLTIRALDDARIQLPFGSALRGGGIGLALGFMVGSYPPSMLLVVGLQLGLALRLWRRMRFADGTPRPARALPVFATSIHKVALLVVAPTVIESPLAVDAPLGATHLSWLHVGWLAVGWMLFAPYALAPRTVSTRPSVAAAPALLIALWLVWGAPAAELLGLLKGLGRDAGELFRATSAAIVLVPLAAAALALKLRQAPASGVALGATLSAGVLALGTLEAAPLLMVTVPVMLVGLAPRALLDARPDPA